MESVLTRKVAFTPASLDALSQGSVKDPLTPGLSVEVLPSGKKAWKYTRRVSGSGSRVRLSLGLFPVHSIADARKWAAGLNDEVELGVDPREALRIAEERTGMTVGKAHELYMTAVREGRGNMDCPVRAIEEQAPAHGQTRPLGGTLDGNKFAMGVSGPEDRRAAKNGVVQGP